MGRTLTSKARSRRSRRVANSAGRVQPLLLVKNLRNKLTKKKRKTRVLEQKRVVVRLLDQLRVLFKRVSTALFCDVCDDQDILNRYFVPRTLYRALVPRERLALCTYVALSRRMNGNRRTVGLRNSLIRSLLWGLTGRMR